MNLLVKRMISLTVIWPIGNLIQQTCRREDYDWKQLLRYSIHGGFFVAPTLHCYMKIVQHVWPMLNMRTAIFKAIVEQVSFVPFSITSFCLSINYMEGKSWEEGKAEVKKKFLPTYKVCS